MLKSLFLTSILFSFSSFSQNVSKDNGIDLSGSKFPWELVIDRGKILGCIYDNQYYSIGSILIEESLPRKCTLNSAREGTWSELSGSELATFEESQEEESRLEIERQKLISDSTYIGNKPITKEEALIIRMIRRQANKNTNKPFKQDK